MFGNRRRRNSEFLLSSKTQQPAHKTDVPSAIWQVRQRDVSKVEVDSQCSGIDVFAIRNFSRPPKLNNKLTKRMCRLLYGRFGNKAFRKLIVSVRELKSLQFGNSPVLLNSTTSSQSGCVVSNMAGSATRRSQSLGINVVAIRKFSCPPQLINKLTKGCNREQTNSIKQGQSNGMID